MSTHSTARPTLSSFWHDLPRDGKLLISTVVFSSLGTGLVLPFMVVYLHEVRHSYLTAGRRAQLDTKALSQRVGHTSVSFTMETYMHGDLEADREVAHALASVILAGLPSA